MKTIYLVLILIINLTCKKNEPSYELYQEVVQTIIEKDSLDLNNYLKKDFDVLKPFIQREKKSLNIEISPPNVNEVDINYILDNFNSQERNLDSLYIINQFQKKCFFKIDEINSSKFSGKSGKWYSFYDLIFSHDLNNVYCNYYLHCGPNCIRSRKLFLKLEDSSWKINKSEDSYLEF